MLEEEEERVVTLIRKCPNMRILHQIHSHIITHPNLPTPSLSFTLSRIVTFAALSPFGNIFYAKAVFTQIPNPSIFSFNSIIRGLIQQQTSYLSSEPLYLFKNLLQKTYPSPNMFTLAFVLKACAVLLAFKEGQQLHKHVIQSGYSSNFIQTSLLNFYAKCDEIEMSRKVFDKMSEKNVVAWSSMINGYSKVGMVNEAFSMFREMQKSGVTPNEMTLVGVVSACAMCGALDLGKWVHAYINKNNNIINNDLELSTALVNMYAKCGCIDKAKDVFYAMPVKDAKAWSSLIIGLAIHGRAEEALLTFSQMVEAKVEPDHITLIGVLSACAHRGLVSEGKRYWYNMFKWGMVRTMEHYSCMVDLFCRANQIEEAYKFVENMPILPNPAIWRTLLVACKRNKLLQKGEIAAQQLFQLEPFNAENYILLSSMYASRSEWVKMSYIRSQMKDKGIKNVPGCSSIEIDGYVHEFVMGDWSHPEVKEIRMFLQEISERVSNEEHEPWISKVLSNMGDNENVSALYEHSERLAIAFGLLKVKAPGVIRIVKNLRVCTDCHEVTKIISRLYNREIVVRDRIRFHKFVNGFCSCKDFW